MANEFRPNLTSWTIKTIGAALAALPLLLLVMVCLFALAGTARANIFVSRFDNAQVDLYDDSGMLIQAGFITGGAGSEGFACVKLSKNKIFVANNSPVIGIFDINTGAPLGTYTVGTGSIAALGISADGNILYAAAYGSSKIYAVNASNGGIINQVTTSASHDLVVGPDGNIYSAHFNNHQGVKRFSPTLVPIDTFIPDSVLPYAGGMVFDGSGNLWVTNTGPAGASDGIWEFTGPLNAQPGRLLNKTVDANAFPLGLDISPLNPPPPPNDSCKGCIVVAELRGKNNNGIGSVSQIDPATCTGTISTPGTCSFANPNPYISLGSGAEPKYVHFSENCSDVGYVEICKLSCLFNPVTGYFDFTASNSGVTVGPLSIPVNACSPPIQIPNGTVNIKETQRLGVLLTGVIAYDYDYFGNQISALLSKNLPFTNANVNVISGDISTETVVGFTNCASGPGELKICKVAGSNDLLGDNFMFNVQASGPPVPYMVPAGPPPGGYCVVAGSYPAGTPVMVTEPLNQHNSTVSSIAVAPPDRQGTTTANSVIAVIDSGTTEVTFTDVDAGRAGCPTTNLLYSDGPVNAGQAAWPISLGTVTSDTFTLSSGSTLTGFCFSAWVSPGDVPQAVEASVTSDEFGGTTYLDATVNLTCQLTCRAGQLIGAPHRLCGVSPAHNPRGSFDVYACSAPLGPLQLSAGGFWLNLQNATTASGSPVYWDQNNGPSSASENQVGTIPAETFVIY